MSGAVRSLAGRVAIPTSAARGLGAGGAIADLLEIRSS